ncbi:EpsG family protein [Variovorax sp. PBS-H4]|uniref:EpsG family protein n=1 Tax=Variovorax sp. PBS-H4 TaxID=434008 RepID=UPI0013A5794F|nr:EpsG family protein [Variovorax sp. PBS-H4]
MISSAAIALGCAVVVSYELLGTSRDYENYIFYFSHVLQSHNGLDLASRFEPGFFLSVYLFGLLTSSPNLIYGLIVWAIVFLKYLSISSSRSYWFTFLVFSFYFFTRYFVLFEVTVLRAACAFSIAFFVFARKESDRAELKEVVMLAVAALFHYSAVVFLFVYLARNLTRIRVVALAIFGFAVIEISKNFFISVLPGFFSVFETYDGVGGATLVPLPYLVDLIFFMFMLGMWGKSDVAMKYCALGVAIGAAFHFGLVEHSVLASRFRELLSMFLLVYVVRASVSEYRVVRWTSLIYAVTTGVLNIYLVFVYDPLLS